MANSWVRGGGGLFVADYQRYAVMLLQGSGLPALDEECYDHDIHSCYQRELLCR